LELHFESSKSEIQKIKDALAKEKEKALKLSSELTESEKKFRVKNIHFMC